MQRSCASFLVARSALVGCWLFVIALALAGCGSPTDTSPLEPGPLDAGLPDADASACAAGELTRDDGTCQPAGLPPDMPCPPGELLLDDGTCQKAGVPPSACAEGFEPDGKDGCEPILPAAPCPLGQMAVPGETACREVAPCGGGAWGEIPVEANTQFVDQAYAGGNNDGTQAAPWTSIQEAIDAAEDGAIVAVAAGSYAEDVLIQDKPVRLWGRCPSMVEVTGAGAGFAAVQVLNSAASEAEVRGVAATGAKAGILASGVSGAVIDQVWIHDAQNGGVIVSDAYGPTSVTLRGSLVEQNHNVGVSVDGSDAVIEATMVRSTLPNAQGNFGRGIEVSSDAPRANLTIRASVVEENRHCGVLVWASDATIEATVVRSNQLDAQGRNGIGLCILDDPDTAARANVTIRACLVEDNHQLGVFVVGSDAAIEATVIRSTLSNAQGGFGHGINVLDDDEAGMRANVTIRACLFEENHEVGVFVVGSDATIESTVVRSTLPGAQPGDGIVIQNRDENTRASVIVRACLVEQNHNSGMFVGGSDATIESTVVRATLSDGPSSGEGISIRNDPSTPARANVTVRACLLEQNRYVAALVTGSEAVIEATVIRSTLPDAEGTFGRGIAVQNDNPVGPRANVTIRACLVEQNHDLGVFVGASDATLEATVIRSTLPDMHGEFGQGVAVQDNLGMGVRANATLRACLVEKNHGAGVYVSFSEATIEASIVRDTAATSDGTFGDGITVQEGKVTIQDTEVTRNARAGVANFSGELVITGGIFACNAFDLDYETTNGTPGSFDGSTGWQCSSRESSDCTELGECKAVTSGLAAPPALPPVDPL